MTDFANSGSTLPEWMVRATLHHELDFNAQAALHHFRQGEAELMLLRARASSSQRVFWSIHSFCWHAATISHLFFGKAWFCAALRRAYGLPSPSALESRRLRDHLTHIDERLGVLLSTPGSLSDMNIGPRGFNSIQVHSPERCIRDFDPLTMKVLFQGEELELRPLQAEIANIAAKAREFAEAPWPQA